jgi:hypothetical protein
LPRVLRIRSTARSRCSVRIRNGPEWSAEQKRRQARARLAGTEPTQCLCLASFMVDGEPMCRAHAGKAALRILMVAVEAETDEEECR